MRELVRSTRGQSLVEAALSLPILLLLVLGIADLGRFAYYAIAVSNATREAAQLAATEPARGSAEVRARTCQGMSLDGGQCAELITVRCERAGGDCDGVRTPGDARVSVRFSFFLLTGFIADRVGMNPIPLSAEATFPGYTQ
jgi:hypothetical protein